MGILLSLVKRETGGFAEARLLHKPWKDCAVRKVVAKYHCIILSIHFSIRAIYILSQEL